MTDIDVACTVRDVIGSVSAEHLGIDPDMTVETLQRRLKFGKRLEKYVPSEDGGHTLQGPVSD